MSTVFKCTLLCSLIAATTAIEERNGSSFTDVVCVGNNKFRYMNERFNCIAQDGGNRCDKLGLLKAGKKKCRRCCKMSLNGDTRYHTKVPHGAPGELAKVLNPTTKQETQRFFKRQPSRIKSLKRLSLAYGIGGEAFLIMLVLAGVLWRKIRMEKFNNCTSNRRDAVTVPLAGNGVVVEMNNTEGQYVGIGPPICSDAIPRQARN